MFSARGTLFASRPEAAGSHSLKWITVNIMLFLLPFIAGLFAVYTFGDRLGVYSHKSPHDLACTLVYFATFVGVAMFFFGQSVQFHLLHILTSVFIFQST